MQASRRQLEDAVVAASHALHARGWVANHDGNVTARWPDGRILATPTAVSKRVIDRAGLVVVDAQGSVVSGRGRPFGELDLHLAVYRRRPDVMAVLHSHAPHATAMAVAGVAVRSTVIAEAVVSLGEDIPFVAYAAPKSPEALVGLGAAAERADVATVENHGVFSWGPDLETALLRMELVEHLARVQLLARQAGAVRDIPAADVAAMLQTRRKAGLARG